MKELRQTIHDNLTLLLDVLNERLTQNPNNILQEEGPGSEYLGATSSVCYDRFIQLKPKAQEVMNQTERYFKSLNDFAPE